jgi:16S rRNA (guanine527-N7)-methyltransferase
MEELAQWTYELTGYRLSVIQLGLFRRYEQVLYEWNALFNLTAIRQPQEVRLKHFLDSLACLLALGDVSAVSMIDVGTGAGFPGLPLKIARPEMRLTLVESVGKKADFCRHLVSELGLVGVEVIQARAEEVGQSGEHREKHDWAISRAVATMPVLAEYLLPLVKVGGCALAMKGESGPAEAQEAEPAIRLLGGRSERAIPVELPGVGGKRYLVVVRKESATPSKYPRRTGVPAKRPLA